MPRLLNINNYHYRRGGSDVVYLEHGALFEELGWDCGYFSMRHPQNLITPWSRHFVDEVEFELARSLSQKARMAAKVVYSFEAQRRLRDLLREFQADVAQLHCIYHHLSPAILPVLKAAGVRTVMTAHDLKIACPAYKMLNQDGICERCRGGKVLPLVQHRCIKNSLAGSVVVAAEAWLHQRLQTWRRHLDCIVVPSRFFRDKFVEWGWPEEAFAYIPNFVDACAFVPQFDAGADFLYFGRLAEEKGLVTLIHAAARAGTPLRVVGTGPQEAALKALATELQAPVSFLGYRSGAALHDEVRRARAVVLPSEWYENAPMSVLESHALGKPVIGADIGGIPELIQDGQTGWIVPSGQTEALADCLAQVAALPSSRIAEMGHVARQVVSERYTRERYRDAMLELYARLGTGGGRASTGTRTPAPASGAGPLGKA